MAVLGLAALGLVDWDVYRLEPRKTDCQHDINGRICRFICRSFVFPCCIVRIVRPWHTQVHGNEIRSGRTED